MVSSKVKRDLGSAGFVLNDEKSIWEPRPSYCMVRFALEFCGGLYSHNGSQTEEIFEYIEAIRSNDYVMSARQLASFVSKIISTGAVVGNVSRIMTRHCSMSIVAAQDWDSPFKLDQYSVDEINFWRVNLENANTRYCFSNSLPNCFVYSDASGTGCGAHMALNHELICHNMWTEEETGKSSTLEGVICNRICA